MTTSTDPSASGALPGATLDASRMPGHWLLARLGKRVLRPGGVELTHKLLDAVNLTGTDNLIEIAPGLGATTRLLLDKQPASYTGVDRDPAATSLVEAMLDGPNRQILQASASETGLEDNSADVVFGEAYLTMHPDSLKQRTIAELSRVLRPGGRFALHEVAFAPDDIDNPSAVKAAEALKSSIKVNVTPMTVQGWSTLLSDHGLRVEHTFTLPLHLLEPQRIISDEGYLGAAKFVANVARDSQARSRVMAMRQAMRANEAHLQAIGLVATKLENQ
ncbi:MAG: class I SAM-dependent methyltransferase [Acidimicrobiales bacterium]|nr:class I SAM-dependent methyltransferase [Acidimicrobiales bacterium]